MSQIIKFKIPTVIDKVCKNHVNLTPHCDGGSSLRLKQIFNFNYGFSLLELMIVVTIVAILAKTFFEVYPEYLAKAQIAKTVTELQIYRKKIEIFYVENNTESNNGFQNLTSFNQISNESIFSNYNSILSSITLNKLSNNTITLTANFNDRASSEIQGMSISLDISANEQGIFSSLCSSSNINQNLLPQECRRS